MNELGWREIGRERVFTGPVFTIAQTRCLPPGADGAARARPFSVIESRDWAIVVPVEEGPDGARSFVMARQWRHGALEESLEFPGGVIEAGEPPEEGARRELREETGREAGRLRRLAVMSPNPAIMNNRVHFFAASDLRVSGAQRLDADEFVAVETRPESEVIRDMGKPPYVHALMACALHFYLRSFEPNNR